ncbi:hypothetical protein AB0I28_21595 [Phytomonospora sp. NPDC050363]|uniref:hypothetical protein n=1 Tax=Phytomonospora sp. NPDC050363 TaxID=3155642 RepID=UPI0033CB830F
MTMLNGEDPGGGPRMTPEEFLEKLDRLTIRATSPDRSVRAVLDMSGTRLEFGPRGTRGHSERSLGEQVSAALEASQHGYQRAMAMLLEQAAPPGSREKQDVRAPEPRSVEARYRARLGGIDVQTRSPRGCVKVRRTGTTGVEVEIRPNTLGHRQFSDADLLAEINAAVGSADEQYTVKFEVAKADKHREDL